MRATTGRAPATSFVGRQQELAAVERRLRDGERLVTVVGPGGIGKTRLASCVAADRDRAWFFDLTEARDLGQVAEAMAATVGAPIAEATVDAIGEALAAAGPRLVVLDNCEQIAEQIAGAIVTWLERAPETQLLVTSRERLRLGDEVLVELGPLAAGDAVELFVDRARRVAADYSVDDAVARRIVAKLDGMPLAIELAAARAGVMNADELLARLEHRFEVLARGSRGAPGKHQTLRATIDWSWELLDADEQSALRQLSVFRGGFALAAAERVVALDGDAPVLDVVQLLRDKSLLRAEADGRLGVYPSVREYAAAKLDEAGGAREAVARHASYYSRLESPSLRALEVEQDNLAAVVDRALTDGADQVGRVGQALRAALALAPLRLAHGPLSGHVAMLDWVMTSSGFAQLGSAARAEAYLARGRAREMLGARDGSVADYERALALAGDAVDRHLQMRLLLRLGALAVLGGRYDDARNHYEIAYLLAQQLDDRAVEARALANLAVCDIETDRPAEARGQIERARAIFRDLGDRRRAAVGLGNIAIVLMDEGRMDEARLQFDEAIAELDAVGDRRSHALFTASYGTLEHELGNLGAARLRYNAALQVLHEVGHRSIEGMVLAYLSGIVAAEGELELAAEQLASADDLVEGAGEVGAIRAIEVCRGLLDVARGDPASARARLAAVGDDRPQKVRVAVRILERALAGDTSVGDVAVELLVVGPDARWFEAPNADRVDLTRRANLRRVLAVLVDHHGERGLDTAEVFAAGWPGERINRDAAANRVRVAVATLRRLGLRPYLLTRPDGYVLAPGLRIERG